MESHQVYQLKSHQLSNLNLIKPPKSFTQNPPHFSGFRQQLLQILGFQTQLPRIGAVQGLHISSEAGGR